MVHTNTTVASRSARSRTPTHRAKHENMYFKREKEGENNNDFDAIKSMTLTIHNARFECLFLLSFFIFFWYFCVQRYVREQWA